MPYSARQTIASFAALLSMSGVTQLYAQPVASRAPVSVSLEASMREGSVIGMVKDERGFAVSGVAVTAIGTIQALAKTDVSGQFKLILVPGDYILRASRDGYVSPYRAPVRIRASAQIERNITITRQPDLTDRKVILAATGIGAGAPDPLPVESVVKPAAKSDSLQAWYLRHLPRSVLRDGADPALAPPDFHALPSLFDRAFVGSARAAASFFADTDFSGQVNMLTTSAVHAPLPRGVAYLSVGAPVRTHGDWRLRGALSTGGLASWVALAEYQAREVRTHAFRAGMSYGAQRFVDASRAAILAPHEGIRTAASVYASDRWRANGRLEFDYGLRADRYDYVTGRNFLSPRAGVRTPVWRRSFVTASVSSAAVAPGVDAFHPPSSSGPWLPPDRTFTALVSSAGFQAERVTRYELGGEREFGPIGRSRRVAVRWFREETRNQLATVFGLDAARGLGHYYVATVGDVRLEGIRLRASGSLTPTIKAAVDYSVGRADWQFGPQARALALVLPSALPPAREHLHDLGAAVQAAIPESQTTIYVVYRTNTAFLRSDASMPDGRFDIQVRQALPFQPIAGGRIEVLVSMSNMFRDVDSDGTVAGSFYDELLTVRPPRRVLGGVQVRF